MKYMKLLAIAAVAGASVTLPASSQAQQQEGCIVFAPNSTLLQQGDFVWISPPQDRTEEQKKAVADTFTRQQDATLWYPLIHGSVLPNSKSYIAIIWKSGEGTRAEIVSQFAQMNGQDGKNVVGVGCVKG